MARKVITIHPDVLHESCAALGLTLPPEAAPALAQYLSLLTQWNAVMNLVGTRGWQNTLRLLVADSFHLAEFLRSLPLPDAPEVWDLGAGAGLPGIPLRILWQPGEYRLVELREKRALFLSTALAHMSLPRTHVFRGRAEDFFVTAAAPAHVVVSRAFMPWPQVLELVRPHLASGQGGGRVIFLTLQALPPQLPPGWQAEAEHKYKIGKDTRYFWCLQAQS